MPDLAVALALPALGGGVVARLVRRWWLVAGALALLGGAVLAAGDAPVEAAATP